MRDENNTLQSEPASICEVFAAFYEKLYHSSDKPVVPDRGSITIKHDVTVAEVADAIKHFKTSKSGADDGLVAEMLKHDNANIVE